MSKNSVDWTLGDRRWVNSAIDCDGDVWGQRDSGVWVCLTDNGGPYSTEMLAKEFGPVAFAKDGAADEPAPAGDPQ